MRGGRISESCKGNMWRFRRDDAPAEWGGYNQKTPQQSGAATTQGVPITLALVVAAPLCWGVLLFSEHGSRVPWLQPANRDAPEINPPFVKKFANQPDAI